MVTAEGEVVLLKDRLGKFLSLWRRKVVLPHLKGRLLDIGCGANELVRSYGGSGVGVDVFQWGDVDVIIDDASCLPFDDSSFDTVTVIAALNHIPNRREALAEIHRILLEDGLLLITMLPPFISKIWHKIREPWDADQTERGMQEGEVYGLTRKEVQKMLEYAGFFVQEEKRFMLCINTLYIAKKRKSR